MVLKTTICCNGYIIMVLVAIAFLCAKHVTRLFVIILHQPEAMKIIILYIPRYNMYCMSRVNITSDTKYQSFDKSNFLLERFHRIPQKV